ncbi:annexin-like protein RJ4 [Senna tora]|uniref:Annexin n=1 Tax=Senna tora TaxID=362788 RepID=A0A834TV13_9FABA|nr:annexin-like protein RJ4 [Senna tora]
MASLIAPLNHSPHEDAEYLQKAVKGWGTDENSIITILGRRSCSQRQEIRKAYEQKFQEDLIQRIQSEISGDFERALSRWILEAADRNAVIANEAIKKGKDYQVIVEVASVNSPEQVLAMRRAYHNRYKHSLEEDVASQTSSHLRHLLVGLVSSYRYDGNEINESLAKSEADILHEAIKNKNGDMEEAIRILCTRSKTQLLATFNKYRELHGTSITKKLLNEASNDLEKALHTTIRCINDPMKYYEKVLRKAMLGMGTDEDDVTRVIVTRAEIDLKHIKDLYYNKNSSNLDDDVAKETSGDYLNFLLALLGKQDQ